MVEVRGCPPMRFKVFPPWKVQLVEKSLDVVRLENKKSMGCSFQTSVAEKMKLNQFPQGIHVFDVSKGKVVFVYTPVYQPIPKKPSLKSGSFWWHAWHIAKKWNEEFGFH